jgi:oxygen-independent coproporphyrinogen-3 oxidase
MNVILQPLDFDPALTVRCDVRAPRYTRYPTAPQFHIGFGETQLCEAILTSNKAPQPRYARSI